MVIDGVPMDNSSFSTSNFNRLDDGGTGFQGVRPDGRHGSGEPGGRLEPERHRVRGDPQGSRGGAIYGARAGAGVILITTKSGRAGPNPLPRSAPRPRSMTSTTPTRFQTSFGRGDAGIAGDTSITGQCGAGTCHGYEVRTVVGPSACGRHASIRSRERHLSYRAQPRQRHHAVGRERPHDVLPVGENNALPARRDAWPEQLLLPHGVAIQGIGTDWVDNLRVGADLAYADSRGRFIQRGNNTNGVQLGDLRNRRSSTRFRTTCRQRSASRSALTDSCTPTL